MEVVEESQAVKANLSVSSYTITNLTDGSAYGKRLIGKASIRNNAKVEFNGAIRLQVWQQPVGSSYAWAGSSHTYSLELAAGKIASIDFEFDDLNEGDKYYIAASYVNQSGELGNGGVWDLGGWTIRNGILSWKNDGTPTGKAYTANMSTLATVCGVLADCSRNISRMTPNRNPNTIYAFGESMVIPATLDGYNTVSGKHASSINMVNDQPFFTPVSFEADSASFTYTFSETEDGTHWHAFTMPFEADSIFLDSIPVSLDDSLKHFWIYEFAAQGDNGEVIFAPATVLRGSTPYIIAADSTMAGRSIVFRSLDVPFYKTGSDKMVITSQDYKFHGNTYAPKLKNCYILNEEGTAFEYVTTNKLLPAMAPYFTTTLPAELLPLSIVLPEIPKAPMEKTGDLNGDGKTDIADAVSVLNIMAEGSYSERADINGDKSVDIADFVSILNLMAEQ